MRSPEVVIVGAGPVGLALALALARAGRRVLVLEKEPSTAEHSRAPGIWPRTQEVLSDLGVIDAFLARGITLPTIELRDAVQGGRLLSIPVEELADATPYPHLLILPQAETERLLRQAVESREEATVLFSAQVLGLEQNDSGVRVTFRHDGEPGEVHAAFAVGCDGARSTVRESLGASFDGETYGTRAALADVRPAGARGLPFPRLSTRDGLAVAIRIDDDLWRLILPFGAGDDLPLDDRIRTAAVRLFPDVASEEDYETVWRSEFRLHRRVASRFVHGRIALAGDAAHLNSPVGGQGMNAGIQDAAVLAHALGRALDGHGVESLADYERVRRGEIQEGVNAFTDRMTRVLLFGRGRAIRPVLSLLRLALRVPTLRRRFLFRLAMLPSARLRPGDAPTPG